MILKDVGTPWRVKQLDDDTLAYIVPDANPRTNAGKMCATVTITTEALDRDGDVIVTRGVDLSDHRRQPVVYLAHQPMLVVGKAQDPLGNYTVKRVGDGRIDATTYFCKSSRLGEEAFRLVEEGLFGGASIGFSPVTATVEKWFNGHREGKTYKSCRPHEYSHLPNNSNPECLVRAVEKGIGGRRLCDPLYEYLLPLVPERAPVVRGGFDNRKVTKAMNPNDDDDTTMGGAGMDPQADPMAPDAGMDMGDPAGQDPAMADPTAGGAPDPMGDHKSRTDEGAEQLVAALWDLKKHGVLDKDKALALIGQVFDVHSAVGDPHGDADADGTENADDLGDLDVDDDDEADGDDDSGDADMDLNDDVKEKAEKAMRVVWNKSYAGTISRMARGLVKIANHPNPCPRKIQAGVLKMLDGLGNLPEIDGVIEKSLQNEVTKAAVGGDDFDPAAVLPLIDQLTNRIASITG